MCLFYSLLCMSTYDSTQQVLNKYLWKEVFLDHCKHADRSHTKLAASVNGAEQHKCFMCSCPNQKRPTKLCAFFLVAGGERCLSHWRYIPTCSRYLDIKEINQGVSSLNFYKVYLHPVAHSILRHLRYLNFLPISSNQHGVLWNTKIIKIPMQQIIIGLKSWCSPQRREQRYTAVPVRRKHMASGSSCSLIKGKKHLACPQLYHKCQGLC